MNFLAGGMKNIMRKKLRSLLTIGGIAIGVLSVIIISIIGEVGKVTVNSELNSMGIGGLCVRATGDDSGNKVLSRTELEVVQKNSSVSQATPLITDMTSIVSRGLRTQAVVWGIDSNASSIVSMELMYGRLINKSDINSKAQICVVDESFAKLIYKRSNIVGKSLNLLIDGRYVPFTVVGVVESGGNLLQSLMGEMVPTFLYAPYTTVTGLSKNEKFSQIVAKLKDSADETVAAGSIVQELNGQMGGTGKVKVENLNQQKDKLNGILNLITTILSIIGGISLIVAGLSIMTVMLVTVNERTREIGIKKSIGASRRIILLEFLSESLLLSLIGSIIGSAAGIALGGLGCMFAGFPLVINLGTVGFCILFSVCIGIVFGVYPARKAAMMRPVEALRYE